MGTKDLAPGDLLHKILHSRSTEAQLQTLKREVEKQKKYGKSKGDTAEASPEPPNGDDLNRGGGNFAASRVPAVDIDALAVSTNAVFTKDGIYTPKVTILIPPQYSEVRGFIRYRLQITPPSGDPFFVEGPSRVEGGGLEGCGTISFEAHPKSTVTDYIIRVQVISDLYGGSEWSAAKAFTISPDTTGPAAPSDLAVEALFEGVYYTFTLPSDSDYSHSEVYIGDNGSFTPGTGILVDSTTTGKGSFIWDYKKYVLDSGPYTHVGVRNVDLSGNFSTFVVVDVAYGPGALTAPVLNTTGSPQAWITSNAFDPNTGMATVGGVFTHGNEDDLYYFEYQFVCPGLGETTATSPFRKIDRGASPKSFVTSGLLPNETYLVRVRGVTRNNLPGPWSNTGVVSTSGPVAALPPTWDNSPAGDWILSNTWNPDTGLADMRIRWDYTGTNLSHFDVQFQYGSGDWSPSQAVVWDGTGSPQEGTIFNLNPGKSINFRARTVGLFGVSNWSTTVTTTTASNTPPPPAAITISANTWDQATATANLTLRISRASPETNVSKYVLDLTVGLDRWIISLQTGISIGISPLYLYHKQGNLPQSTAFTAVCWTENSFGQKSATSVTVSGTTATGPDGGSEYLNGVLNPLGLNLSNEDPTQPMNWTIGAGDTTTAYAVDTSDLMGTTAMVLEVDATIVTSRYQSARVLMLDPDIDAYSLGIVVIAKGSGNGILTITWRWRDASGGGLGTPEIIYDDVIPTSATALKYKMVSPPTNAVTREIWVQLVGDGSTASSVEFVIAKEGPLFDDDDLAPTGVTGGTYRSVTVDDTGRVTAATNPTTTDENARVAVRVNSGGTPSVRRRINVIGTAPITAAQADDGANEEVDLTLSHATSGVTAATYDLATVTVNAEGHITAASDRAGTSFPGSPANNDPFYHTTQQCLFYYNSTISKWLSVHSEPAGLTVFTPGPTFLAGSNYITHKWSPTWFGGGTKRRVVGYSVSFSVATTNDGSNYWRFHLIRLDNTEAGTTVHTLSSSASAPDVWVKLNTSNPTTPELTNTDYCLYIEIEPVGTPGDLELRGVGAMLKATS